MPVDKRVIESNLPRKGFVRVDDADHHYFYHRFNGKETGIHTKTSHGSKIKTYGDSLLNLMKKQLKLDTNKQVFDLVTCPMTEDEYNQILKNKGLINSEEDKVRKVQK